MERWVNRSRNLEQWLAILLSACALVVMGMTMLVDRLPIFYLEIVGRIGMTWQGDIAGRAIVSAILMLPPTLIFGSTFPVIAKLAVQNIAGLGRGIGAAYAANTVGAIAGSLLAGFALLPMFGIQRSIEIIAAMLAIMGMVVLCVATQYPIRKKLSAGLPRDRLCRVGGMGSYEPKTPFGWGLFEAMDVLSPWEKFRLPIVSGMIDYSIIRKAKPRP
jgi:spermidine synthase